ncbi:MAG: PilZ domain-containing protein [Verrucomicrobiota bacterium]|jgi:hypothetical protein|nr:PilZ domain-containing protein [Verrucomicrobiota bacterium]
MTAISYSFGGYNVSLMVEEGSPIGQLDDLSICHLGMRFIAFCQIPEFSLYEFQISLIPLNGGEGVSVRCCGIVVQCAPEGPGFRTIIHFCDMDETAAEHIEQITKANHMRCDYCANC